VRLSDEARAEAHRILSSALPVIEELLEEGQEDYEQIALDPLALRGPEHSDPGVQATRTGPIGPTGPTSPQLDTDRALEAMQQPSAARAPIEPAPGNALEAPVFGDGPTLESVRGVLGDCRRCKLCEGRSKIVFGDGDPQADLMFIGEGPGEHEDLQGLPFVGKAGGLLTQMIEKGLEIPRSSVYICNIVKCRPPGNRNPLPPEVAACRPFLDGQIDAIRPKVIVTLGKPATSLLLDRPVSILRTRGTWHEYRGIPLMPTLHPAYVLRQYTDEVRRNVWEDLKAALTKSRAS
jgi:uracil-DNA glycosylase family 4